MLLNDTWILNWARDNVSNFSYCCVNPASLDVRLSDSWILYDRSGNKTEKTLDYIVLHENDIALASTIEYIRMPDDVAGQLLLKSSVGREWIDHSLAGFIDPGFEGELTLELKNIGKTAKKLSKGDRIAQIIFYQMISSPEITYAHKGHYQGQKGATKSWRE